MEGQNQRTLADGFRKIDRIYTKFVYYVSQISPAFLIIIMFVAVADTLSTKLFSHSIKNAYAIVQYFSVPNIYLSVATVQMSRGHTNMGMFQNMMPKIPKMLCRMFSSLLGVAVCVLMSWESCRLLVSYFNQHTTSTTNGLGGLVLWPFVLCFVAGYTLLTLAFVFSFFRALFYRNDVEDTRSSTEKEAEAARQEADQAALAQEIEAQMQEISGTSAPNGTDEGGDEA